MPKDLEVSREMSIFVRKMNVYNMANQYFDELIHSVKPNKHARMSYETGEAAGLHTRGNVLLGSRRFLTSLKPRWFDVITMNFLF